MVSELLKTIQKRLEALQGLVEAGGDTADLRLAYNDLMAVLEVLRYNYIDKTTPFGWSE